MAGLPSVFPSLYVAMVRASETTGTVKTSVRRYMQYQKQVDEIRRKLLAAATYPAVLVAVASLVVTFLMLYVVPRFSAVFDEAGPGRHGGGFVQVWGGFVRHHGLFAWSLAGGTFLGLGILLTHAGLRAALLRRLLLLPVVGARLQTFQLARLFRTLGMLLRSGVSALMAMRMTTAAMPPNLHGPMQAALQLVSEGRSMSSAFAECGLSTEVSTRLLVAGESTGNLDDMMEKIADFYDQELATWIDTAGRLIEPALMIGIGLVIGAVVLMLYMPIFDLTGAIS
jgi:general secretion pathway protein F